MRSFSTIGWFMCQAIGTMQLDRDASPLGLVARAWCSDWQSEPFDQKLPMTFARLNRTQARFVMGQPHPSLRGLYEQPDPNDIRAILQHVKEKLERTNP